MKDSEKFLVSSLSFRMRFLIVDGLTLDKGGRRARNRMENLLPFLKLSENFTISKT